MIKQVIINIIDLQFSYLSQKKISLNKKVNGFYKRYINKLRKTVTTINNKCLNLLKNQKVVSSCKIKTSPV